MIRLTLLLLAAMFATALIGGRDYGQMRPGLKAAALAPATQSAASPATVAQVSTAADAPAQADPVQSDIVAVAYSPPEPVQTTPRVVTLSTPAPAPEPAASAEPAAAGEVWIVNARAVNVREGPSTDYGVIGKLSRGEAASIVWEEPNGWARIRIEGDGIEGFVSMDFLTREPATN